MLPNIGVEEGKFMHYCAICGKLLPKTKEEFNLVKFTKDDKSLIPSLKTHPSKCILCTIGWHNKTKVVNLFWSEYKYIKQQVKGKNASCKNCMYFNEGVCTTVAQCRYTGSVIDPNSIPYYFIRCFAGHPKQIENFIETIANTLDYYTTKDELTKSVDKYWYLTEYI